MTIQNFTGKSPNLGERVYIADSAIVIGHSELGDDVSIWPTTVVRGDIHSIRIGARTNIQDGSILHVTHESHFYPGGFSLTIGDDVTVGHRVILHGCIVESHSLIGMGAVVMDGAIVRSNVLLGAGSLVPPGKELEAGYLWVGNPVQNFLEIRYTHRIWHL